jgi:hypothetical protein
VFHIDYAQLFDQIPLGGPQFYHGASQTNVHVMNNAANTSFLDLSTYFLNTTDNPTSHYSVYPNPAHNDISFEIDGAHLLTITNALGMQIAQTSFQNTYRFPVADLPAGHYNASFSSPNGHQVVRFVVGQK